MYAFVCLCVFAHGCEYASVCVSACASLLSKSLPECVCVFASGSLCWVTLLFTCVCEHVCMCMYVLLCEILLACLAFEEIGPCFSQHRSDIWRNGRRSLHCRLYLCHVLLCSSLCAALAVCGCFDISQVGLDSATFCLASQKVVLFF